MTRRGDRYEDRGPLGRGALGEVRRVHDRVLNRTLAMKVAHPDLGDERAARFVDEARATARLQHPHVVAVHDLGALDDPPWFTMREVRGQTLREVVDALHGGPPGPREWTLRRVVTVFHAVCRAFAHAHEAGVTNGALGPDDVVAGDHGEVVVRGWGGSTDPGGPARDVAALGALLHAILSGRPPGPAPLDSALPVALVEACASALGPVPPSSQAFATRIGDWLEDANRRERALAVVERAVEGEAEARYLLEHAAALRARGDGLLAGVHPWQPEEDKAAGWALQDEAAAAEREASLVRLAIEEGLQGALRIDPRLPEAHAALAVRLLERHAAAEAARDREGVARAEAVLTGHVAALPEGHPVRREAQARLRGDGALTLVTDPPGAEVLLHRYVEHRRRLVPVFERSLGRTPLREVALPMGSYLCVLRHPGRPDVRYPIHIGRQAHWDGVAPGGAAPTPIWLPPPGTLGEHDVYVPAGWFASGGDAEDDLPPRRLWCDAFVAQRFLVTNREYLAFLDDLAARGREDEAVAHAPRERVGSTGATGAMIYGRDGSGRFVLRPDADGDAWHPDWPVFMVTWNDARAWLAWWAERTGRPWRLPGELEWEKAARGVDGRTFPWGDAFDPSWCLMLDSHRGKQLPAVVDSFPVDEGPHGVRGLAGNIQEWCLEASEPGPAVIGGVVAPPDAGDVASEGYRIARGGAWSHAARSCRCAGRHRRLATFAASVRGFRGVWRPAPSRA